MSADDYGYLSTYTNHRCRCVECRKANAEYHRISKIRRAGRPVPEHLHGSAGTYGNYGCRCRPCTDAWEAQLRRTPGRRKGRTRRRILLRTLTVLSPFPSTSKPLSA